MNETAKTPPDYVKLNVLALREDPAALAFKKQVLCEVITISVPADAVERERGIVQVSLKEF